MNRNTVLTLASIAAAAASLLGVAAPARAAGAADGVACPANTEAALQGGVLTCKVTLVYERASVCPPINFPNYTNIKIAGRDTCEPQGVAINNKASVASAMAPLPGPPRLKGQSGIPADLMGYLAVLGTAVLDAPANGAYDRVESAAGSDKFVAEKTVFLWPKDYPVTMMPGRNPERGVACPAGFDDVSIAGGRGLRCELVERKTAGCDALWKVERDVDGNKDACFLDSPIGRTKGNYTIPVGTTGITGNPETHGWNLKVRNGADVWEREQKTFRIAEGR